MAVPNFILAAFSSGFTPGGTMHLPTGAWSDKNTPGQIGLRNYHKISMYKNFKEIMKYRYNSLNTQYGSSPSLETHKQKSLFSFFESLKVLSVLLLTSGNVPKCPSYYFPGWCLQQMEELIHQTNLALIFLWILSNHSQLDLVFQNVDSHNLPNDMKQSAQYFRM